MTELLTAVLYCIKGFRMFVVLCFSRNGITTIAEDII